jgi:hypothetical protein
MRVTCEDQVEACEDPLRNDIGCVDQRDREHIVRSSLDVLRPMTFQVRVVDAGEPQSPAGCIEDMRRVEEWYPAVAFESFAEASRIGRARRSRACRRLEVARVRLEFGRVVIVRAEDVKAPETGGKCVEGRDCSIDPVVVFDHVTGAHDDVRRVHERVPQPLEPTRQPAASPM